MPVFTVQYSMAQAQCPVSMEFGCRSRLVARYSGGIIHMIFLPTRRRFLKAAAVSSALVGLGDLSFLSRLPRVSAQETNLDPKAVRLGPEIEPLVRFLEETPRARLLEEVALRLRRGLSYRELLG